MDEDIVRLSDEKTLSKDEIIKRTQLGELIVSNFPKEVFEKMSVWQPAVGCLNSCSFCSQEAGTVLRMLDGMSVRTIAGAFLYAVRVWNLQSVTLQRKYKPGIVFPYLDNDIGSYPYLLDYLAAAESLNIKVRTSTIGWSRKNKNLNAMHESVIKNYRHVLAGVRFSLTAYSSMWHTNRAEFVEDFINAIKVYRPILGLDGDCGACIDVDFKPDIVACNVNEIQNGELKEVIGGPYRLVMRRTGESPNTIDDAYVVVGGSETFGSTELFKAKYKETKCENYATDFRVIHGRAVVKKNEDGIYYGFYPEDSRDVTDGIFFFPTGEKRTGGVFVACWPLREFENYISEHQLIMSTYEDVQKLCHKFVLSFSYLPHRNSYLENTFVPFLLELSHILQSIGMPVKSLFDRSIVRDRGMIRNSGRAYYEFRNIASAPNIMVVPDPVLTQTVTDTVWRIFPSKISFGAYSQNKIGKKSLVTYRAEDDIINCENNEIYLIAWEVDAPSHSHHRSNGSERRSYKIPISKFITTLHYYDRISGKSAGFLPGV